jgi:hypothetical protein
MQLRLFILIPMGFHKSHEGIPLRVGGAFAVERIFIRSTDLLRQVRAVDCQLIEHRLAISFSGLPGASNSIEVKVMQRFGIVTHVDTHSFIRGFLDSARTIPIVSSDFLIAFKG